MFGLRVHKRIGGSVFEPGYTESFGNDPAHHSTKLGVLSNDIQKSLAKQTIGLLLYWGALGGQSEPDTSI